MYSAVISAMFVFNITDNDECADKTATCDDNNRGQCVNTVGSYECGCNEGYELFEWRVGTFKADPFCRGE